MADQVPPCDVLLSGTLFLDIVLTGLEGMPRNGTEVQARGMGSCPGGIANFAVAAARLGLRTTMSAAFGDDVYADFCWRTLSEEGVDLTASRRFDGWHTPVTVSMADRTDRAMVTHAHPSPMGASELLGDPPPVARAAIVHLTPTPEPWVDAARSQGTQLFADVGWDPTEAWSSALLDRLAGYHAFMPNGTEAMAYTRTSDPWAAARALARVVPLAVVTCGEQGAIGIDAGSGDEEWVPAVPVRAQDPTGAGDVFGAALVLGTLRGWSLRDRLSLATLCASLSVEHVGSSLAAPGWGDLRDWLAGVRRDAGGAGNESDGAAAEAARLARRYAFLDDVLPTGPLREVRRARATLAASSDASG